MYFAAIFFKEKITISKQICVGLTLLCVIFVSGVLESASLKWTYTGIIYGALAFFFYGVYGIFSKQLAVRQSHYLTLIFYGSLFTAISISFVTVFHVFWQSSANQPQLFLWLGLDAVFLSVILSGLYAMSMNFLEAGKVAILVSGETPAAMVMGLILYHE